MKTKVMLFTLLACFLGGSLVADSSPDILRGFNLSNYSPDTGELTRDDFRRMKEIGVTLIRLDFSKNYLMDKEAPYLFNEDNFERLHKYIGWAEELELKVIIDPHSFPGTILPWTIMGHDRFWFEHQYRELVVKLWARIARECSGYGDVIWGYDLINEPYGRDQQPGQVWDLNTLYKDLIQEIRRFDNSHSIILMFHQRDLSDYAQPPAWYQDPVNKLIYSPHLYWPQPFTHQGLSAEVAGTAAGKKYPDPEKRWTREAMEQQLQVVIDFKKRHGVEIFFGEFSCNYDEGTCWDKNDVLNPHPPLGGDVWLKDVISLFEKHGFHWTYHCYEDWEGWDATVPHPRWLLIQSFFKPDGPRHPSVSFAAPLDNARFEAGQTVTIIAEAWDENGSIDRIEFFNRGRKIGEVIAPPYTFDWEAEPGSHRLQALVTDNSGATQEARPVDIVLQPALSGSWKNQDVGGTAAPGCAWMIEDNFVVQSAEDDLYQPGQGFHFLYQTAQNDVTVTCRLIEQSSFEAENGAGLMLRQTGTVDSPFAELLYTKNRILRFRCGDGAGETAAIVGRPSDEAVWFRLCKEGNQITGFTSDDGLKWSAVGAPVLVDMGRTFWMGLAVRAYKDVFVNTVRFDQVRIESP